MPKAKGKRISAHWIVIGIVGVLIIASVMYLGYGRRDPLPSAGSGSANEASQPTSTEPTQATSAGSYTAYSPQAFADDTPTNRKVLFFHASWCPQCRAIEKDINQQGVPNGITFFKVDYDNSADLKAKYGVTLQTTMVEVDASGNLIQKHVAYNQPTLPAVLDALGR